MENKNFRKISKDIIVNIVIIASTLVLFTAPTLAQNNSSSGGGNFICDSSALTGALEGLLTVIVVAAALISIVGGALFTLAAAARPGNTDEYATNRNRAILYGLGSLVVLYGAEAIVGQVNEQLSYDCVLPFTGSS